MRTWNLIFTILFADDQDIISDSEDNSQAAIYKLNKIITEYGLTISTDQKVKWWYLREETQQEVK
jgi:hypothetical protein